MDAARRRGAWAARAGLIYLSNRARGRGMTVWNVRQWPQINKLWVAMIALAGLSALLTMVLNTQHSESLGAWERTVVWHAGWILPVITMMSLLLSMYFSRSSDDPLVKELREGFKIIGEKLDIVIRNTGGYDGHGGSAPHPGDGEKAEDKTGG